MARYISISIVLLFCCFSFALGWRFVLSPDALFVDRLLYSFCHCNVFHLLANMWCAFLISKSDFRDTPRRWALALFIAFTAPSFGAEAMGMSGVLYALMGMLSWQALYPRTYHLWAFSFIAVGFLFPSKFANMLHLYCYCYGIFIEWTMYKLRLDE